MKKRLMLTLMLLMSTFFTEATELKRSGWNLISVCEDINRTELNLTGIEEIQSQDGQTLYTGDFASYSNLNTLYAGYGYWIKGDMGINFNSGESKNRLEKPLNRDGWNLMASCEDIPKSDLNMTNFEEIQSQDGETLYTGTFVDYSNLNNLESGYGYWVKGNQGTLFTSKRGLSIPAGFNYQMINNAGTVIETNYAGYRVVMYANYEEQANAQQNHIGIGISINENNVPLMNIQSSYQGHEMIVAIFDADGNLVVVSDQILINGSVTLVALTMDDIVISPPLPNQLPIAMINQSADEFNATITQGTAITLSADGSYDSDGNITACEWRIGNSVMVSRDGIHTCSLYNLTLQSVGTYVYTLSVTDNQGATTINHATIVVNAVDNGNTECTQLTDTHPTFTVAKNNILLEVSALFNGFNVDVTTNTDMTTTSTGTIAIYGTIDGNNTGSLLKLNGNYVNGSKFVVKVYKENTLVGIGNEVSYSGNGVLNFGTIQVKKCEDNTTLAPPINEKITLSGKVTYDRVHVKSNYQGLDYNNITQENAQQVVVEAIDVNNTIVATTTTDDNGEYFLSELAPNQNIKIRVLAKMFKEGSTNWDVKVVDNTNGYALYVMESSMFSTGTHDSIRNLNASSTTRTAAPFALLDNVYDGMQKVMGVQSEVAFPPLMVNWSVNNKASGGNIINGDIGTSYYTNGKLFILGDSSGDSDEYDDHVIAHEWGHYYEDKFSRTDSIGGAHGDGDHLDIRVAFGEGFGNAMSAIATDNPIYFDTFMYNNASNGWYMNIENGVKNSPGWFSESSIQRILYDLYDSNDDGSDHLSLGFSALHEIFIGAQKDTQAFTSIFSFITELKLENPDERTAVDNIVASESMATISDIYGSNRTNLSSETPLYTDVTIGGTTNVCTKNNYGSYNKLSNRKYIQFNVSNDATYTIRVAQSNGSNSDPDFLLYKTSPHTYMGNAESADAGIEVKTLNLSTGSYLLDISDYNNISAPCFNVTVNP